MNGGAMTVRRRRWLGAFFFALMFTHFSVSAYSTWMNLARLPASSDGWTARTSADGRAQIVSVDQDGPATALRVGDDLISINGLTLRDDPEILSYNQRAAPGTRYMMVVRRQGQSLEFTLTTARNPIRRWLEPIAVRLAQLLFLLTGLTVFLLKPTDRQAWLLALMLGAFTGLYNPQAPQLPLAIQLIVAMARIMAWCLGPVFCHLFLIFPDRSPLLRRFPSLERRLYWPFYLCLPWLAFSRFALVFQEREPWAQFFQELWLLRQQWIAILSFSILLAYLAVGLAALFVCYRVAGVI